MKKRGICISSFILACLLVVCGMDAAIADTTSSATIYAGRYPTGSFVEGLTIDKLSTRSGPSTQYRDTGTYKVKGQYVGLISYAYDNNDVCWLQCEVSYGNKLRRLYTGLKRFDINSFDLSSLPQEDPFVDEKAKVIATSKAMYGPGNAYSIYDKLTVDKGQTVLVIAEENGYVQVEWTTTKQSYRAWVPASTLQYQ